MGEEKDEGKEGMKQKREAIITYQEFIVIVVVFSSYYTFSHLVAYFSQFLCLPSSTLFLENNAISLAVLQWVLICIWIQDCDASKAKEKIGKCCCK